MQLLTVLPDTLSLVVNLAAAPAPDQAPADEDVKAGWIAFALFIGLIVAVALLGFSLVKRLRKAEAAEEAGLYDPSDRKRPVRVEIPQESPESGDSEKPTPPTA